MSFTEEIVSERLNRRQFVKVAAGGTLGLAALLAGCGSSTGSSLNSNGSAAIEFLAVQQAGTGWPLVLSTITDQYAKTHSGTTFKVDFAGQTGLNQKVQLLAAQGALPILYNTPPADLMAQLVKNGEGLDIESTFQQLGVYQELVPSAVALLKQVYGSPLTELPFELNIEGFWYNKQIFAQNGLQPPDTWDQLVQIAASLQQKGIQPLSASGIQGWPITRLISGYLFRKLGPNAMNSIKSGQAKLTDPAYVEAAQAVANLGKQGYFGKGVAHDWAAVRPLDWDLATLVTPTGPPVRRIELVAPVAITTSPTGRTIVDFGQNLVGRLRITVRGKAGQAVTLRHAEVLEDGELCTRPLRTAKATDRYTLRGGGVEIWEPRFTFHGFRYAEVEDWPGTLQADDIRAVVCHTDLERTGWFECSDPLINRLHENVVWSMRGNFLDVPTDCPQRDERLGWTGDIQVFAPTACFLYNTAGFLTSWLADLAAEQTDAGVVPFVVPNILPLSPVPAAAWGDAAVIVPWVLYQRYGDTGILAAQFESMRAWVDLVTVRSGEGRLWDKGFQFGDWLDPSAPPNKPGAGLTNPHVVATAYFARSAELLGQIAGVLGRSEDEAHYLRLAAKVRDAFNAEYVTPAGRVLSDSATAYALALQFGLLKNSEQRRHAAKRLVALVRESGYHISTGFVGTPLICDALCSVGEVEATFHLLNQHDCPSWLYPVTMGATTIWERWDSLRPDGSINPNQMTSFNHYALGAVVDWLHRTVGGLAPASPGYRHLDIRPRPGGGLIHARARHITPYGLAESGWTIEAGQIEVVVVVPPNAEATVTLPGSNAEPIEVGAGTHRWSYPYHVKHVHHPRSLDSTISEFIDDSEAWATVLTTMRRHMPQLSSHMDIGTILQGDGNKTLGQMLSILPHAGELRTALEAALATLER